MQPICVSSMIIIRHPVVDVWLWKTTISYIVKVWSQNVIIPEFGCIVLLFVDMFCQTILNTFEDKKWLVIQYHGNVFPQFFIHGQQTAFVSEVSGAARIS